MKTPKETVEKKQPEVPPVGINVETAAKLLGLSAPTLYNHLCSRPDFPAIQVGIKWVVDLELLKEWLHQQCKNKAKEAQII